MYRDFSKLMGVLLFLAMAMAVGCPTPPEETVENDPPQEEEEENNNNNNTPVDAGVVLTGGTGSIAGKIINRAGTALAGLRVLACSSSLCMTDDTDGNGEYFFADMDIEPRHVQITDLTSTYLGIVFFQDVFANQLNVLSRSVIIPNISAPASSLPVATGGTVTLADGALEITVAANSIEYPFGYNDEIIQAERLTGEEIPPYDLEPWMSLKEESFAFIFFPVYTAASENVSFVVKQGVTQPEGTDYFVWEVKGIHGTIHEAGTATVDSNGHLVSNSDATVKELTTLIFIPDIEVEEEQTDAGEPDSTDAGN